VTSATLPASFLVMFAVMIFFFLFSVCSDVFLNVYLLALNCPNTEFLALPCFFGMMESSGGTAQKPTAAPCLARAKPIISRPMQRATYKTYSTGENRGNGEGILCSLGLLLFKSGPDVKHFLDKYRTDPGLLTRDADSPLLLLSLVTVEAVQPPGSAAQAGTTDH